MNEFSLIGLLCSLGLHIGVAIAIFVAAGGLSPGNHRDNTIEVTISSYSYGVSGTEKIVALETNNTIPLIDQKTEKDPPAQRDSGSEQKLTATQSMTAANGKKTESLESGLEISKLQGSAAGEGDILEASFIGLKPEYPRFSRQHAQQGRVLFEAQIGKTGKVVSTKLIESSGYHLLDQAAQEALAEAQLSGPMLQETREMSRRIAFQFILRPSSGKH